MKRLVQWLLVSSFGLTVAFSAAADSMASLSEQSQMALEQGQYARAASTLELLAKQADTTHNSYWQTWVQAMHGFLALQQRQYDLASQYLDNALATANAHSWPDLIVRISLYRGQLQQHNGLWLQADQDYATAEHIAIKDLLDMQVSAVIHRAALAQQRLAYQESGAFLHTATQLVRRLPEDENRVRLELDLAYQSLQLRRAATTALPLENVYNTLTTTLEHAKKLHLARQTAQALGYFSELYTLEKRDSEVGELLQHAIFYGQQSQSTDLLLHFEWQLGRYYTRQGQQDSAIAAYRRAVEHIQTLRQDIPVTYKNGHSSFQDILAPAYLELATLLFDKAKRVSVQQRSALLQEAQGTVEYLKKSELEDYFQNRCELPSVPLNKATLPSSTAVLYPIIFPEHLDLLLLTKRGLQHFSTPVPQMALLNIINDFAGRLNAYDDDYRSQATTLYRYLIQPITAILTAQHINTLVYIPDGPLRRIPLSALHDGQHYVVEHYAVVVSPGLSISHTAQAATQNGKVLLAGLSKPGNVVNELPKSFTQDLSPVLEADFQAQLNGSKRRGIKLRSLIHTGAAFQSIQAQLTLPSVSTEMTAVSAQLQQATPLINKDFTLDGFSEQIHGNQFRIVHIASHGFFDGTEQNSFIMTYDHILTMSHLETLLNSGRGQSPELIVLSACQTAEGDDRSPLGMSGVVIKAKVKNVLGSLWPVSDDATTLLMDYFYQNLKRGLPKVEALRQAQLVVMRHKDFASASFWSPFVLVGNGE